MAEEGSRRPRFVAPEPRWRKVLGTFAGPQGWLVLGISLFMGASTLVSGWLEPFELRALNLAFHLRGPRAPQAPVVVVAVDENSFDELDLTWPWPRQLHGQLVSSLREAGAVAVAFDLLFSEPSLFGVEDDLALAKAVADAGNVILAAAITVTRDGSFIKEDLNAPLPTIRKGAAGFGPVNFAVDDDAFVRSARLTYPLQGRWMPGFSLVTLRAAGRADAASNRRADGESILINYRGGPGTFPTFPYHRVVDGQIPADEFRGKIVLVGATSPALHDVFPTPFAPRGDMPGVEIHANLIETIAEGIEIRRVPRSVVVYMTILAAAFSMWVAGRFGPLASLGLAGTVAAGYLAIGLAAFTWMNVWADFVATPLALALTYGGATVQSFIREQRERRRLSRFFSPEVVREVVRQRDEGALGSSRRMITVLFCDIRDFTSIAEKLAPEDVADLLREYLTEMTEAVFRHGGTVDKFIGDAIMALYNAPLDQPDHAVRAVRTAIELRDRAEIVSARWRERAGVTVRNGVGIHTGDAVVGTLGSKQRLEYTAVGDGVNVASRIEGLTKQFAVPIVVSEATYDAVKLEFAGRLLGEVTVKGREHPLKIYTIETERRVVSTAEGHRPPEVTSRGETTR